VPPGLFRRSYALSRLEKPTSVRLPPDLLQSVRRAAEEQGCAVSFKIAQILREWEAREKRRKKRNGDELPVLAVQGRREGPA
jgi:hypothetical protein